MYVCVCVGKLIQGACHTEEKATFPRSLPSLSSSRNAELWHAHASTSHTHTHRTPAQPDGSTAPPFPTRHAPAAAPRGVQAARPAARLGAASAPAPPRAQDGSAAAGRVSARGPRVRVRPKVQRGPGRAPQRRRRPRPGGAESEVAPGAACPPSDRSLT